jgi:hypothetical protein
MGTPSVGRTCRFSVASSARAHAEEGGLGASRFHEADDVTEPANSAPSTSGATRLNTPPPTRE